MNKSLPIADCRLPNERPASARRRIPFDNQQSAIGISFPPSLTRPLTPSSPRPGFTLIEMIVVITIIVIAMTLAVPAIRSLTGSRSQEAAQNVLTTALGSVRAEAMALQRVEGIMFFLDTSSDRIQCVAVMETPNQPATDHLGVTYLDLVPDKDPISLPNGIWCWTMKDQAPTGINGILPKYRYLGYNLYVEIGRAHV